MSSESAKANHHNEDEGHVRTPCVSLLANSEHTVELFKLPACTRAMFSNRNIFNSVVMLCVTQSVLCNWIVTAFMILTPVESGHMKVVPILHRCQHQLTKSGKACQHMAKCTLMRRLVCWSPPECATGTAVHCVDTTRISHTS